MLTILSCILKAQVVSNKLNMEPKNLKKTEMLRVIETRFREKFSLLKSAKEALIKIFRRKLEEKKIEEIRNNLTKSEN